MKVGDLVTLSSAGKKVQSNWGVEKSGAYGLIVGKEDYSGKPLYKVTLFDRAGRVYMDRNFFRYELKFFKGRKR